MKKQKVSLKKLSLSKSKVATLGTNRVLGGGTFICLTDNGCGPDLSVRPVNCPLSHNCPPATHTCPTVNCVTLACESAVCESVVCASVICGSFVAC